jgi:CO/xanthine dehydrogenase Mo-binding subunit
MSEDILSRARLLAKAANDVADQMSLQVDEYKAVIQARKADEAKSVVIENEKKSNHERSRVISSQDVGQQKVLSPSSSSFSPIIESSS